MEGKKIISSITIPYVRHITTSSSPYTKFFARNITSSIMVLFRQCNIHTLADIALKSIMLTIQGTHYMYKFYPLCLISKLVQMNLL